VHTWRTIKESVQIYIAVMFLQVAKGTVSPSIYAARCLAEAGRANYTAVAVACIEKQELPDIFHPQ